jgi:tetratricopeptide (TPR) repeat protein
MIRLARGAANRAIPIALVLMVIACNLSLAAGRELHSKNSRAISLYEDGLKLAEKELFNEALEKLKAAIGEDDNFVEAHLRYMDAFRSVGRSEEVAEMYSNMRQKKQDSPVYNFLYGRTLRDLGEKRAAYRKALALDSTFYFAQLGIGGAYLLEGRLDEALVSLNKVLELRPGMIDALRMIGQIYMDKGMPFQAKSVLEEAMTADSSDVQVLLGLGQAYSQLERFETAEKIFRRAAALEPGEPQFQYYLALICDMSGRQEEAVGYLGRFLKQAPDHELAPMVRRMLERLSN